MIFEFANFAETRLEEAIAADSTTLRVPALDAAKFPALAVDGAKFAVIIYDGQQSPEIAYVSAKADGIFTVERAKEGTTPRAWLKGTAVINSLTAGTIGWFTTGGGGDEWVGILSARLDEAFAAITHEQEVRADEFGAFASEFEEIRAEFGTNVSTISTLSQAFADLSTAWGSYQVAVNAEVGLASSRALFALDSFVDLDIAMTEYRLELSAAFAETEASLLEEVTLRASQYEAQVINNSTQLARIEGAESSIEDESITRADQTGALSIRSTALEAEMTAARSGSPTLSARLTSIVSAAATDLYALATRTTVTEAQLATTSGSVLLSRLASEESARASGDGVQASRSDVFDAKFNTTTGSTLLSRLITEEGVRASAVSTQAGRSDTFESQLATTTGSTLLSRLVSEEGTRATQIATQSGRSDTFQSQLAGSSGSGILSRLVSEEGTRATETGALASRTTTVEAQMAGTSGSVIGAWATEALTAIANAGDLDAFWEVMTVAGTAIAGIRARANSVTGSEVGIVGDYIALFNTVLGVAQQVLAASGGNVFITNKLLLGSLGQIELDPSYPALVVTIGSAKLAIGLLTNNSMILWFGPSMAISAMTKTNAKIWFDAAGSSYWGGSISAGTLSNSVQGSNSTVPVDVICGPFSSNGDPITIAWSYTLTRGGRRVGSQTPSGTTTATIKLYQKIGPSETLVDTQVVTGSTFYDYDGGTNETIFVENMSGSWTYSDNVGGATDRRYRVEVASRSLVSMAGSSPSADSIDQNYSIVTSEG
jgi:hypothetical protein